MATSVFLTDYSMLTLKLPVSSTFGTRTVSMPSASLAETPFSSTRCGNQIVRENDEVLVNVRSVDRARLSDSGSFVRVLSVLPIA